MDNLVYYYIKNYTFFWVSILFPLQYLFFRLAKKKSWVDIPNERSSHNYITYRGYGILFLWSLFMMAGIPSHLVVALLIVCITGFIDDLTSLSVLIRFMLYSIAVYLTINILILFSEINILIYLIIFLVSIGTLNAINFMDGINGMSVLYAITFWITISIMSITLRNVVIPIFYLGFLPVLVLFGIQNIRIKAKAFMGDSGSLFSGLIMIYYVIYLCVETQNLIWIGFLIIYGLDTVLTIIERLFNRQNIFKAHRNHLYQIISNKFNLPHWLVSFLYSIIQLLLNIILIVLYKKYNAGFEYIIFLIIILAIIYLYIKWRFLNKIENIIT